MADAVGAARAAAQRLNAVSDRAAETVRAVEEFLSKECSVGVYAWVRVTSDEDADSTGQVWESYTDLGYARHGSKFRIVVAEGVEGMDPDQIDMKPWSDCSRELRWETLPKLPALIARVAEAANEAASAAEKQVEEVAGLLSELRK